MLHWIKIDQLVFHLMNGCICTQSNFLKYQEAMNVQENPNINNKKKEDRKTLALNSLIQ